MHFIDKESVVICKNDNYEIDMAFPNIRGYVKEEAITRILENVCDYLFQGTHICPENDPLIRNRIFSAYPNNYKDIMGTAYWGEKGYTENLARIRLYRKIRKMIRSFVNELKTYFEEKKTGVDKAYLKNVNSFTASKKARNCRKFFFNHIGYKVDEKNKAIKAYFGTDISLSRIKFLMMAKEISSIGVLGSVLTFYNAEVFVRDEFLSRVYIGTAKYNSEKETEPFSVEKGKEIAKADLIKRYMSFETKVAKDNYNAFCKEMDIVFRRIDKILEGSRKN